MGYLVIERSDGGVTVRVGVEESADHDAEVAQWLTRSRVKDRGWTCVRHWWSETDPRPDTGAERSHFECFRDAYEASDGTLRLNPEKMKALHRANMERVKREMLPVAVLEADRIAIAAADVELDGAETRDDIKARWPSAIERRQNR